MDSGDKGFPKTTAMLAFLRPKSSVRVCFVSLSLNACRYLMTTAALGLIGVTEEETQALLRALAGVAFLGQVRKTRMRIVESITKVVIQ